MDLNKDNVITKNEFNATGIHKARGVRTSQTNLPVAN
jgi:hypothetical protein